LHRDKVPVASFYSLRLLGRIARDKNYNGRWFDISFQDSSIFAMYNISNPRGTMRRVLAAEWEGNRTEKIHNTNAGVASIKQVTTNRPSLELKTKPWSSSSELFEKIVLLQNSTEPQPINDNKFLRNSSDNGIAAAIAVGSPSSIVQNTSLFEEHFNNTPPMNKIMDNTDFMEYALAHPRNGGDRKVYAWTTVRTCPTATLRT
jgi:hypothetical protein